MYCSSKPLLSRALPNAGVPMRVAHARAAAVKTPSSATASNLLEAIASSTKILPDSTLAPDRFKADATRSNAVVNVALISHILANTSTFYEFANAIEKGAARTAADSGSDDTAALDAALVNLGIALADRVSGRMSIEVDPRLANDTGALVARANALVKHFESSGVDSSRLLIQIPATWAGIQAIGQLEASGSIQCAATSVYSLVQAVAAVQAGASALVVPIAHINVFYDKNPGIIRDPKGPRQDAGCGGEVNVGVRVAAAAYTYAQQQGGRSRIIVIGVRKPVEAKLLSGVDYMIIPEAIQQQLAAEPTLQGYNDGLTAAAGGDDVGVPALSPAVVEGHKFRDIELAVPEESSFMDGLGMAGRQLLEAKLARDAKAVGSVAGMLCGIAVARE